MPDRFVVVPRRRENGEPLVLSVYELPSVLDLDKDWQLSYFVLSPSTAPLASVAVASLEIQADPHAGDPRTFWIAQQPRRANRRRPNNDGWSGAADVLASEAPLRNLPLGDGAPAAMQEQQHNEHGLDGADSQCLEPEGALEEELELIIAADCAHEEDDQAFDVAGLADEVEIADGIIVEGAAASGASDTPEEASGDDGDDGHNDDGRARTPATGTVVAASTAATSTTATTTLAHHHRGAPLERFDVPGGFLKIKIQDNSVCAHCTVVGHGGPNVCRRTRTLRPGTRPGQGAPVGHLLAWLAQGSTYVGDNNPGFDHRFAPAPGFAERSQAREVARGDPLLRPLLEREGAAAEPEDVV